MPKLQVDGVTVAIITEAKAASLLAAAAEFGDGEERPVPRFQSGQLREPARRVPIPGDFVNLDVVFWSKDRKPYS